MLKAKPVVPNVVTRITNNMFGIFIGTIFCLDELFISFNFSYIIVIFVFGVIIIFLMGP